MYLDPIRLPSTKGSLCYGPGTKCTRRRYTTGKGRRDKDSRCPIPHHKLPLSLLLFPSQPPSTPISTMDTRTLVELKDKVLEAVKTFALDFCKHRNAVRGLGRN